MIITEKHGARVHMYDAILTDFTGISALTLGDRDGEGKVQVFFTADVILPDPPTLPPSVVLPFDLDQAGLELAPAARARSPFAPTQL